MAQDLARIVQDPLFLVLLDLSKAYDTLDLRRLMQTLEGYRVVLKLCEIMVEFRENQ